MLDQGQEIPKYTKLQQITLKMMNLLSFIQTIYYGMGVDAGIALLDEEIELLGGKSESLNTLKRDRERKRLEK